MKVKKLLAGIMSATMVLGTMSFNAFAADEDNLNSLISGATSTEITLTQDAKWGSEINQDITVDLNGKTVEITAPNLYAKSNITFKNGNIKMENIANANQANLIVTGNLTFEGVNFTADGCGGGSAIIQALGGTFTTKKYNDTKTTITVKNTATCGNMIQRDDGGTVILEDTTITGDNIFGGLLNVKTIKNCSIDLDNIKEDNYGISASNIETEIVGTTVTVDNCGYGVKLYPNGGLNLKASDNGTPSSITVTGSRADDVCFKNGGKLAVDSTSSVTMTNSNVVAQIGNTYYGSLNGALVAAQDNDTITLLKDAEINSTVFAKDITIDAQDKKIKLIADNTVGGENLNFHTSNNITFKNANITLDDRTSTTETALFNVGGGTTVTFDNVDFTVDGYTAGAVFYNGGTINIQNGSVFVLKNCINGANAFAADSSTAVLNITGSEVSCDSTNRAVINQTTTIDNSTFDVKNVAIGFNSAPTTIKNGSNVTITGSSAHGFTNGSLNIENNSNMTVSGCTKFGVHLSTSGNIIKGNSTLTVTNCGDAEVMLTGNNAALEKEDTSKLVGTVLRRNHTEYTDGVTVSYEDVTVNEGEKVYNIYVEADNKTINRLTSAEFKFDLATSDAINYVVSGTQKVNVTPDSSEAGRYLFNFNGINAVDITGKKICLGQIKFTGYGVFTFSITDGEAHATTLNDNIVTDYVKEPDADNENQGTLDYSVKLENIEIKEPTRKLTINVTFPNAVESNVAAYQDMKVTIKGGKATDETIELGEMTGDGYTIERDLVKDTPYTVTVSGAGYRTASYTVTLNADKTLNFWNNVKTTATPVEVDKDSSAKTTTFLAGEIVKDGKINIYDLSAVVSYFGTINNVNEASDYAQYDLNRDGKVDSKDVAYVLASYNN